jgi:hypothetical protein
MNTNNELIDKLKEFLSEDEIKEGISKGVIKLDIEKGDQKTLERMPLTNYNAGLDSGTGVISETTAGPASWEMVKTSIQKAIEAFEKANPNMSSYVEKSEYKKEEDEEMDKAYGDLEDASNGMKKVMKMYKAKNKTEKSFDTKGLYDQIEKSFNEKLSNLSSSNDQLEKTNNSLANQNTELQKSIDALTEQIGNMKSDIEKIGSETPAPKAVNLQSYIEKGGVKDEEGKKIYHIGMHKSQIVNELENVKASLNDVEKAQVDEDLLNYVSANIPPSEAVSRLLFDKNDVKLVK